MNECKYKIEKHGTVDKYLNIAFEYRAECTFDLIQSRDIYML